MKLKLTSFIILISACTAFADYMPMRLYEMALRADRIVYGEITSLDSTSFTLSIEKNLYHDEESLIVRRFKNWPCGWRWSEYKVGQRQLLFLTIYNGEYHAMSGGNEGEVPVIDGYAYIDMGALDLPPPPPRPDGTPSEYDNPDRLISKTYILEGNRFVGYKIEIEDLIQTIQWIKTCFLVTETYNVRIVGISIQCENDLIAQHRKDSELFDWTFKKLKNKTGANTK